MNSKKIIGVLTIIFLVALLFWGFAQIGVITAFLGGSISLVVTLLILIVGILGLVRFLKWCFRE